GAGPAAALRAVSLLGVEQWVVDQWCCAWARSCAHPKGCTRSINQTGTPPRSRAAARKTGGYGWRICFKVLVVLFLAKVCSAFLPSQKAGGIHLLRHSCVRQPDPDVGQVPRGR